MPHVEYPSRRKERFGERCGLKESTVKLDDEEVELDCAEEEEEETRGQIQ